MLKVRDIKPEMTYDIRHHILRPHQAFEDCMYDTDHDAGAFHVGGFNQDKLVSIASFYAEQDPDFSARKQYRLRAMATLQEYRKSGAGRAVVTFSENLLKMQNVELLWCKARTTVQEYYSKLGFSTHGDVFDYPPIGPHIVMFKELG